MKYLVFVTILFLRLIDPVHAQFDIGFADTTNTLAVVANPAFPAPGETVTVSLDDYALGALFSTISWYTNGVEVTTARNQRSFSLTAPAVGETITITARQGMTGGILKEASVTITSLYTDIIVEPQTYTPRLYQGRAEPSVGSLVRATALVQDKTGFINPSTHSYLWKLNGTTLGGGARHGALQTEYQVPYGESHILSVEVYDSKGQLVARRGTSIRTKEVDLVLYEVHPLYGRSNLAVGNTMQFLANTLMFRAVPYNLDLRSNPQNTFSEWRVGSRKVSSDITSPFDLTLERSGQGVMNVNFKLRHREALLQGGEVSTTLNF
ncbi:MAG: hypothetical protein RLZZ360_123 [Candidatus Parcubacteria bacterium]|jgi:hypothetical protein